MAVYTNDLRLTELATGEGSGTWGTTTNTSLSLIGEAFSFGTEAITTNADTHSTTIADGSTDPGRSLFLKYRLQALAHRERYQRLTVDHYQAGQRGYNYSPQRPD